jgi:hypothetical protein
MENPGHRLGQTCELTLVGKIIPGQVEILRGVLNTFSARRIFVPVEAIHFARFVIVTPPGADTEQGSYLLFTCNYDGDFEALLAALVTHLPGELDAVWGRTEGWPGLPTPAGFHAWALGHARRANMAYTPYPDATAAQIRKGLRLDEAVQELFDQIRTVPAAAHLLAALEN